MKIKILNSNIDGQIRFETIGLIKEVMINEDFLHPESESVALGFKGKSSSGLIEFTTKELEEIYKKVHSRTHLIKGFKILRE